MNELMDTFGRLHQSLRVSVTDRCNIRCFYCMPADQPSFMASERWLSFEQITRLVEVLTQVGIKKIRLTGGEPLLRPKLPELVESLAKLSGIEDLALTTNGMLLDELAKPLHDAGLRRLNISLDTLNEATFLRISRRTGLQKVLQGIEAAQRVGFEQIRLNAIAIRHLTEPEIIPLAEFALERGLVLRFIEYMPLDADRSWQADQVLNGTQILHILETHFGTLIPQSRPNASQPAEDYQLANGQGSIGIIRPVSEPFCGACDRLRLTADGKLRNCLFSLEEWDVRSLLSATSDEAALLAQIRACVQAKRAGHLISQSGFEPPTRAMYQIGG